MGIENDAAKNMSSNFGANNKLLGDAAKTLWGYNRMNGRGGGGKGQDSGGGMTPEQISAMNDYNSKVHGLNMKAADQTHKHQQALEAARVGHSERLLGSAADRGATNIRLNHATGEHEFTLTPGYGNGGQGESQQQKGTKPTNNTKTAADRAPNIVQGPERRIKAPTGAAINRQNAAADSYITPAVKGSPMTGAQRSQNRAARSYVTSPAENA